MWVGRAQHRLFLPHFFSFFPLCNVIPHSYLTSVNPQSDTEIVERKIFQSMYLPLNVFFSE